MSDQDDPVLKNARREAWVILAAWLACTTYCCGYAYLFGYDRPDRPLGPADVHPILGMPSWVFWGVIVPWGVCALFIFGFAGFVMVDDDLGEDRPGKPAGDGREGGVHD